MARRLPKDFQFASDEVFIRKDVARGVRRGYGRHRGPARAGPRDGPQV